MFPAEQAEGKIGAAGHGRENKGGFHGDSPKGKIHCWLEGVMVFLLKRQERSWHGQWRVKPNPLAGFGRVGCGVFVGGQGTDGHRAHTISSFAAECKQQKIRGGGDVCLEQQQLGNFLACGGWAKKRRPTLRESRPSFKEKGDKSCFTGFVLKQQACQ